LVLGALDTITGCSECLPQEERRSGFFGLVLPEASHELYIVVAGIGRTEWRIERLRSCPNDLGGQRRELGWMVLGEVYAITIELFPIANLFAAGTAYQTATSHISTSTQILASRKASGSSRIATASSPRPPDPRTSCCRSIRRVGENPILGMYGPLRFLTRNVPL
jgi:hypothetical protein